MTEELKKEQKPKRSYRPRRPKAAPAPEKASAAPQPAAKKSPKKSAAPQKKQPAAAAQGQKQPSRRSSRGKKAVAGKLRIIPLGGLGEVGKNLTVLEFEDRMLIVDCGMTFPDEDMYGIDYVIPDITYLKNKQDKIAGIFLTHGHEDHIGALPYVLREINVPVYGTRMTLGIVRGKLREHRLEKTTRLVEYSPGDVIQCPPYFSVEPIRVNHSIADAVALAIRTPVGVVIHTGDYKIDTTPIMGEPIDLTRFGELGREGVLCMMADSTNAEREGTSSSERSVGATFEQIFSQKSNRNRRIIVATFASNVSRVQQVINAAVHAGRKVAVAGRSMVNVLSVAQELGYMDIPKGTLVDLEQINRYPAEQMCLITTGSQGEPMSALYRMAYSDHKRVEITARDTVIISASAIPGNEKSVSRVINELLKSGAEVVYSHDTHVHVSGHACREELAMLLSLVRPKFFLPFHGEYRQQKRHAELAETTGVKKENIFILENGSVLELDGQKAKLLEKVPSGRVLVDGLGVGDVGNIVLRDRRHLAQEGLITIVMIFDEATGSLVSGPDIISRGFVYVREAGDLMDGARKIALRVIEQSASKTTKDRQFVKTQVRDAVGKYIFDSTKRNPMILPVIMEV